MAHPFAGQAKSSQQARLKRLGGTAGKSWGSSQMYKKKSLPKKNAGSSTPMTISGGSAKSRPDRFAFGGSVGDKKKRRPHATTNIIISHAGGRGGSGGGGGAGPPPGGGPGGPVPVPVPRPVPVPVAAGPDGAGPGPVPPVIRPPMGPSALPPGGGLPPGGPPPGAGLPMRPPGMKAGGAVMKAAKGGFLKDSPGKGYAGFPHSPTSKKGSAVSAHKKGGAVGKFAVGGLTDGEEPETGMKKGGGVKKLQFGGGAGGMGLGGGAQAPAAPPGGAGLMGIFPGRQPVPEQQGPPTVSGRPMVPAQPLTVPQPKMGSSVFQRPAPGTTVGYKKGGKVHEHEDEVQDKKLIKKMIAKKKDGGGLSPYSDKQLYHQQGKGYASGGSVQAGAGSGVGRLAHSKKG